MKVAITGGSGFLGKEVISALEHDASYIPVIIGKGKVNETNHEYRTTDYSRENLKTVLTDIKAVIHLAAKRGTGGNIADYHTNINITNNLYESCTELGITNIVFSSTISIYSDVSKMPWSEESLPSTKTFYSVSKLACEHIGNIFHKNHGLNIKSLRIAQILGEGEIKGMLNTFIDNAFEKRILKVTGKSVAKREFVYVKDVARAVILALKKDSVHGSFNIGSKASYSNYEIATMVNDVFDNKGNLFYDESIRETIESSLMDSSKAGKELGYLPQYSLKEALKDILKIKKAGKLPTS